MASRSQQRKETMSLQEKLAEVSKVMRDTKTAWVATEPENTDLVIYLHFWRGEEMVVSVLCALDRDTALRAGEMAAAGYNADIMSVSFESYSTPLKESPLTGEAWKHMEMQYVVETVPDAYEKGWVSECITTSVHDRNGGYALHMQPYRIHGTEVEYSEETGGMDSDTEGEGGGVMHDWMQHIMTRPKLIEIVNASDQPEAEALGFIAETMPEEEQLAHYDLVTSAVLMERELATGVFYSAPSGSLREQMLKERVEEYNLRVYTPEKEEN
jgi:hypothetical protein